MTAIPLYTIEHYGCWIVSREPAPAMSALEDRIYVGIVLKAARASTDWFGQPAAAAALQPAREGE